MQRTTKQTLTELTAQLNTAQMTSDTLRTYLQSAQFDEWGHCDIQRPIIRNVIESIHSYIQRLPSHEPFIPVDIDQITDVQQMTVHTFLHIYTN